MTKVVPGKPLVRNGPGWSKPITDFVVRRRAALLAESPITPIAAAPAVDTTGPIRSKAAIDAAMASRNPNMHLSVSDRELDGVLSAGAMHYAAHLEGRPALPQVPDWLARRGGISEAAKVLTAIVIEFGACRPSDVWARIGNALGEQEWSRFLDEALSVGIVLMTPEHHLVARKGAR
jgi:hypothetical protein